MRITKNKLAAYIKKKLNEDVSPAPIDVEVPPDTPGVGVSALHKGDIVSAYVVSDSAAFVTVLNSIGTTGGTDFGNKLENIIDELIMTKMSGMNITPLNDEVAKGLDFADAMAGIGNGASLGSIGQNKKFAISYKTSVLVDNFQSGGSINMSSNSWKKFLTTQTRDS